MSVAYIEKLFLIFTLSVFFNIYNINCGCCCNSCKGNKSNGNGGGIKKIFIKVTADSININGKILNKVEETNKQKTVVNSAYISTTDVYNVNNIDLNNNYEIVIEDNIKNKPYIIAIVEVEKNDKELDHYIVSALKYEYCTYGLFNTCIEIKRVVILESKNATNMSYMFEGCSKLTNIDFSNMDTSKVTDMSFMFHNCSSLQKLNLFSFNTSKVINMGSMFSGCSALKELNINNLNTLNVTDMSYMFCYCESLEKLDLSNWNTSNVTNMSYMFNKCINLTELDLSNFDSKKVNNKLYMFNGCSSLENNNLIVKDKNIFQCFFLYRLLLNK